MSSATEFVQATVRKSLTGAAVGAGVGAGVGVLVQFASSKKASKKADDASEAGQKGGGGDRAGGGGGKTEPDKDRYPDLYAESEVYWLVECMKEFRNQLPMSFDEMMVGLDRFCALRTLVHTAPKEDFKASWAVTAHHHVEIVRDAIREIRAVISSPAMQVEFDERNGEIDGWLVNELHNVSMQVQTRLQDDI